MRGVKGNFRIFPLHKTKQQSKRACELYCEVVGSWRKGLAGMWWALGLSSHLRWWHCRESACALHVTRERESQVWDFNHLLTQPTCSLLESSWNSRMKCFARIYWSVSAFSGQLSRLNVSIRSEFCSSSDLYLLIQQNWTVSQEPIDPVKISVSGWLWHFTSVRSMFCCHFIQRT